MNTSKPHDENRIPPAPERRLAAILSADVCGYSRLMGDDDEATVRTLEGHRGVFRAHIPNQSGRIIDTAGDSVLAEFPSVISAVQAAIAIQRDIGGRNEGVCEERTMRFRIGINIGDVIGLADGTIYGDGVNIAARIESLADPGGIGVSGPVFEQIDGRIDGFDLAFCGEHQVKNIAKPVRVYRVVPKDPKRAEETLPEPKKLASATDLLKGDASPTILIVDDNADNRYTLGRRLRKEGYVRQLEATDGAEALRTLETEDCELILLDIMMPNLNGYETLERIKTDVRLRNIPVIMISAVDDLDSVTRCLELGADDYLPKPFNAKILRARVGACIERKRLRDELASHLDRARGDKKRAERVLASLLPAGVVGQLKKGAPPEPREHEDVVVLSAKLLDFAHRSASEGPGPVLAELRGLTESFEQVLGECGLDHLRGGAGAWLAAGGLLYPDESAAQRAVDCAYRMLASAKRLEPRWQLQVGIHRGTVYAGIVGRRRLSYEIWGEAADVAQAACDHAAPGTVALTASTYQEIADGSRGKAMGAVDVPCFGVFEIIASHSA